MNQVSLTSFQWTDGPVHNDVQYSTWGIFLFMIQSHQFLSELANRLNEVSLLPLSLNPVKH